MSVCLSIFLSIHQSVCPTNDLSVCPCLFICQPCIYLSLCPSIRPSIAVCLSVRLYPSISVRPSLSVRPSVRLYPSVHLSISICPSVCLSSVCLSVVRPSVHLYPSVCPSPQRVCFCHRALQAWQVCLDPRAQREGQALTG